MQSTHFYELLKDKYSTEQLQILLPAIRQDQLIYQGLLLPGAMDQIADVYKERQMPILPGQLVLASVYPDLAKNHYPQTRPSASTLEKWMVGFEAFKQEPEELTSINTALDLSLAIAEKRKILSGWQKIIHEIFTPKKNANLFKVWKTPLILCSQIIDHPEEMLIELSNPSAEVDQHHVWMVCILCSPVSNDEKQRLIHEGIKCFCESDQLEGIRFLQQIAGSEFSTKIAQMLAVQEFPDNSLPTQNDLQEEDAHESLDMVEHQALHAMISHAAGDNQKALKWIRAAKLALERYQSNLNITEIALLQQLGLSEQAKDQANTLQSKGILNNSDELIMALEGNDWKTSIEDENKKDSPLAELLEAKSIQAAGNCVLAREAASAAYWKLSKNLDNNGEIPVQKFAMNWTNEKILDDLISFDLPFEAGDFSLRLLQKNPSEEKLLRKAGSLMLKNEKIDQALEIYQTLEFLEPDDLQVKRSKALCLEKANDPEAAFLTWSTIVDHSEQPDDEDLLSLAENAMKIKKWDAAIESASRIPTESTVIGKADAIIGYGQYSEGNKALAEQYLSQAIEHAVTDPNPWIVLSEIYTQEKETQKASDILRAAKAAFPESSDVSYRLAKCLSDQGAESEAMGVLAGVIRQDPDHLEAQLLNAKLKKSLHLDAADQQIEQLAARFPDEPEVNYLMGCCLVQKGMHKKAVDVLTKAVSSPAAQPEWIVMLADALAGEDYGSLGEKVDQYASNKAEELLHTIDLDGGSNAQASVVQAEIDLRNAKTEEAYEVLSQLNQGQKALPGEWYWRIQTGIARAAAATGKFEIALASIQEAIEDQPQLVGLRKVLAEIYQASGRMDDALDAANKVMTIAPEVVENVLWFASFLKGLGKETEAEKVLDEAIQKNPEENRFPLELADLYAQQGQKEKAMDLLEKNQEFSTSLNDCDLLYRTAVIYHKLGESGKELESLQKRYDLNPDNLEAGLDLAGSIAASGDGEKSLNILNELEVKAGPSLNIGLFKVTQLVHDGQFSDALVELPKMVEKKQAPKQSIFLPDAWNKILLQKEPDITLAAQTAYLAGDFVSSLNFTKKLLEKDPKNETAIFINEMANRAQGIHSVNAIMDTRPLNEITQVSIVELTAYEAVERNDFSALAELYAKMQQISQDKELLGALNTLIAADEGNIIEAEAAFGDCSRYAIEEKKILAADEAIKIALIILAAEKVQHWPPALRLAHGLYQSQPTNFEYTHIYLSILAKATEEAKIFKDLGLKVHAAEDLDLKCLADEYSSIEEHFRAAGDEKINRMMTRCKLALQPDQANLKAMALYAPTAEDVAAMMIALHQNGQDHTAVQVGKRFDNDLKVLYTMAVCQSAENPVEAVNSLHHLLEISEAQPTAWMLKSQLEGSMGKKQDAIDSCENALSYWPEEINWQITAANLWESAGDLNGALSHLETAHDQEPENSEIMLQLGRVYSQLGLNGKSIEILGMVTGKETNNPMGWEALADAYYRAGDAENAEKAAEKASNVDAFSTKPYLLTGKIALENGDLSKAMEQARKAVSKDEKKSESITFLAKILLKKGEKTQALAALEKAAACEDATLETMIEHAKLVREIKGPANSKVIIEKLVERYPENLDLIRMLIEAQNECGERAKAEETARMSLKIQPEQPDLHFSLGNIKMEHGDLDQAIFHFSQSIAMDNQMIDAYIQLANVYKKQRNFHQALATLQQAIHIQPRDSQAYLEAAGIMRDSKDYQGAEKMLRKASEIAPNDLNIKRQLGAVIALNLVHNSQQASSNL